MSRQNQRPVATARKAVAVATLIAEERRRATLVVIGRAAVIHMSTGSA